MLKYLVIISVLIPAYVHAANLYLEPASGEIGCNDSLIMEVKINTANDECINAGEVSLKFPKDILSIQDFSSGESIFTLWANRPGLADMDKINQEGLLSFSGGIPGGYCGTKDQDFSLGKIIFKSNNLCDKANLGKAEVTFLGNSKILLNNEKSSPARLTLKGSSYIIVKDHVSKNKSWLELVKEDRIPPERFTVEVISLPDIYGGNFVAIFQTTDKQTGVDHYEVFESKTKKDSESRVESFISMIFSLFKVKTNEPGWVRSESPYLLADQSLQSIVKVKAVDKAGNERIENYTPETKISGFGMTGLVRALFTSVYDYCVRSFSVVKAILTMKVPISLKNAD